MGWLRSRLFDLAARVLTKPRGNYNRFLRNDMDRLRQVVHKGDVVLVDGDQRVSEVIKYLTQSSWSHVALYVGDEILQRFPAKRNELIAAHGADAHHMIIEALLEGVVVSPLSKYGDFNLRICRPSGLQRDDRQRVLDEVIAQLGSNYDLRNLFDLARYFFPVSLIPRRFRRRALRFGSGLPTEVMCSSLIARAFQNVGFPILPQMTLAKVPPPTPRRLRDYLRRRGRNVTPYSAVFHRELPALVTPRDFDLSPYFDIVKFNNLEAVKFDYRRIKWA
jgi:hypothetical protein